MWTGREIWTLYSLLKGTSIFLTNECPDLPAANAPKSEIERYEKWFKADEMAHCNILALMSSVLQHQLKDYLSATDMSARGSLL